MMTIASEKRAMFKCYISVLYHAGEVAFVPVSCSILILPIITSPHKKVYDSTPCMAARE